MPLLQLKGVLLNTITFVMSKSVKLHVHYNRFDIQ